MTFDPIKLCCGKPQSQHTGPQCPDGLVMCCLCFNRVKVEDLSEEDGKKVDVCKLCAEIEKQLILRAEI